MTRKCSWLLAFTGLCLLMLTAPSPAQKEKKSGEVSEEKKAEIREERMQRLMMAQNLAAEGSKLNAPEYLITAAGILRKLSYIPAMNEPSPSEVQPEIKGDGDKALDKEIKALSLKKKS